MPVESRDDLVKRLCDDIRQLTKMVEQASFSAETGVRVKDPSLLLADLENAATRIEADAKRITAVERELDTANANHRDMASRLKDMGTKLEAAERALAEERERHQWRTIDSAPTNGDTFLAWEGSERGPFKCWWRDDWPYDESCWMDPQDSEPAPTHWKPLDIPDATAIRSGKTDGKE